MKLTDDAIAKRERKTRDHLIEMIAEGKISRDDTVEETLIKLETSILDLGWQL